MEEKKHLLLVPSTHWDREWYKAQSEFNVYLTELFDMVLTRLESGELPNFLTDGQAVIVEDMLTLKPQWQQRIARFASEGKLEIGPFYSLTDMYLPSGESFFRNLEYGVEIIRKLSGKTGIPYAPDAFGHNGDLPAILASAGFDAYFFCRGMGDQLMPARSEFIWHDRYNNYKILGLSAIVDIFHPVTGAWICGAYALGMDLPQKDEEFRERLEILMDSLKNYSDLPDQLAINGSDHLLPEDDLAGRIARFNASDPGFTAETSTISDFVARAWRNLDINNMPAVSGELIAGKFFRILTGTSSSRVDLKIRNAQAQYYLEKIVEPAMAAAPAEIRQRYQEHVDNAWKLLLQSQAHDSICGCGTDAVARDIRVRFDKIESSLKVVAERLLRLQSGVDELRMLQPAPDAELIRIAIRRNAESGTGKLWSFSLALRDEFDLNDYVLVDNEGREWDFIVEKEFPKSTTSGPFLASGPAGYVCSYLRIFTDWQLPGGCCSASGFFRKKPTALPQEDRKKELPVSLCGGKLILSGDEFKIDSFLNLCDTTDIGDGYDFRAGKNPQTVYSTPWQAGKKILCGDLYQQEFFCTIEIPECAGAAAKVPMPVKLVITGTLAEKGFLARIFIDNKARDHRLQLIVNTPFEFTEYCRQTQMQHCITPVAPQPEGDDWRDHTEPLRRNFGYMSIRGKGGDFAIMPLGVHEHTTDGKSFALTLLRAVGNLGHTGAGPGLVTPEAQMQGEHIFTVAFFWQGNGAVSNALWKHSARLLNPACGVVLNPQVEAVPFTDTGVELISEQLLISAFFHDRTLDKKFLRIFNPTSEPGTGVLCGSLIPEVLKKIEYVRGVPVETAENIFPGNLMLKPGEIITLAL